MLKGSEWSPVSDAVAGACTEQGLDYMISKVPSHSDILQFYGVGPAGVSLPSCKDQEPSLPQC